MSTPAAEGGAGAILEALRRAEEALAPLVASDVPFVRNGIVPVLVQLRELRAFVDVDGAVPYAIEFE
jgi:molybdopterin-guanine dinucleotide biosynthesis protein A